MTDYPEPTSDRFPDLHSRLDDLSERVKQNLPTHFSTATHDGITKIEFSSATADEYMKSMNADPEAMVPFYMKVTNVTNRIFSRKTGIRSLTSLQSRKSDLRTCEKGVKFAEYVNELLTEDRLLEGLLSTFRNAWQTDQRRHYKGNKFEKRIRNMLRKRNYDVYKGNTLTGEPDIVIDGQGGPEITGEIRSISIEDMGKRNKNFDSEASTAKKAFPDAYFVIVVELPPYALEERREGHREDIQAYGEGDIDAVFFHDEIDQFAIQLDKWGVTRQSTLSTGVNEDNSKSGKDTDRTTDGGSVQVRQFNRPPTTQQSLQDFGANNREELLE